ncbi:hypothetical protein AAU61_19075 [Desulfocarbo indianensis]|nr:hypothetical protein AAU61_19075 [Desulfocarbo indianensis]
MWPWSKKGGERRGAGRQRAEIETGYRVVDAVTRRPLTLERRALIHDLSEEGCGLLVPELVVDGFDLKTCREFPKDYLLGLKLKPLSGGTWLLHATVRWITPAQSSGEAGFRVGARFEDPVALPNQWQRLLLKPASQPYQVAANLADASGS